MKNKFMISAATCAALFATSAYAQIMVPTPPLGATNAATAVSSSQTGSGAEAGVSGLGFANITTISGNESTAGSISFNGTMSPNANLQINQIETYSSTLGGTATLGSSSGNGDAHGGGHQDGYGQAFGQSYDQLMFAPSPNAVMGESNSAADSHGGGEYTGLSFGGVQTIAGNESTGNAVAYNGVTLDDPNLQVNSVITSSSSEGISSVLSGMNGMTGHNGGEADQDGNGNGWGFSWNIPSPPAP